MEQAINMVIDQQRTKELQEIFDVPCTAGKYMDLNVCAIKPDPHTVAYISRYAGGFVVTTELHPLALMLLDDDSEHPRTPCVIIKPNEGGLLSFKSLAEFFNGIGKGQPLSLLSVYLWASCIWDVEVEMGTI